MEDSKKAIEGSRRRMKKERCRIKDVASRMVYVSCIVLMCVCLKGEKSQEREKCTKQRGWRKEKGAERMRS